MLDARREVAGVARRAQVDDRELGLLGDVMSEFAIEAAQFRSDGVGEPAGEAGLGGLARG